MRRRILVLSLLAATLAGADAGRVSLSAAGEPLGQVLEALAEQTGLRVDAPPALRRRTLTLSLTRVPLEVALAQIARRTRLELRVADGAIVVREPAAPAPLTATAPPTTSEGLELLRAALASGEVAAREAFAAWLHGQRPDWREALPGALSRAVLAETPAAGDLHRLARLWQSCGETREAALQAERLRRGGELEAEAWDILAAVELLTRDSDSAGRMARRALELSPRHPTAEATLILSIYYAGRAEEALAEGFAFAGKVDAGPAVLAAVGDILRRSPEQSGAAMDWLTRALALDPRCPDALYGLAAVAEGMGDSAPEAWAEALAAEGWTSRAARARLRCAATQQITLSDRGGTCWDITADGRRILYADPFRRQLQITDTGGFGMAVQVTDQETTKTWAALSPDEEWLAWLVEGRETQLFLQNTHASGSHQEVLRAPRGRTLRRCAWTPDGALVLVTERGGDAPPKLRAWDRAAGREVEPPAELRAIEGLGDVLYRADGGFVGTVSRGERHAQIAVDADGTIWNLRPPANRRAPVPALDAGGWRTAYLGRDGVPVVAAADGSDGGETAILAGSAGRDTEYAFWSPDDEALITSLRGVYPVVLHTAGPRPTHRLRARCEPLLAEGPEPTRFRLELVSREESTVAAGIEAELIADDGTVAWSQRAESTVAREPWSVELTPDVVAVGTHWLRVVVRWAGRPDPPRWYRFEITPG